MAIIPEEDERPVNPDSLPQVEPQYNNAPIENAPAAPTSPVSPAPEAPQITSAPVLPENLQEPRFKFFGKKLLLALLAFFIFAGSVVAGVFFYLNQKVTTYTLLPEETQFYLGLSVKKHPQVQKLLELSKKLPGGEKMVKYIDDYRQEIFGTRKDPFKEILNLAETEVFLAKISSEEQSTDNFGVNTLEKLVNIVQFGDSDEAEGKLEDVAKNSNVTTTVEAYGSAKIRRFELKEQAPDETSESFSTGPLPYQVTLPLSKSIFATSINKFLVAAEEENDIKKMLDVATGKNKKKLERLSKDKEHNEIANRFPDEYLLKFYQRQVLDPFSNLTPGTSLPQTFFLGQSYDTRERETEGDNVFTTKRGLTIEVFDNGLDFTSYQLTKQSRFVEGLAHGFTVDGSLANKLPSVFDSKQPLLYAEAKNVKDSIKDQIDQLDDVAKNSSDADQKQAFERAVEDINELKKKTGELFGVDVDEDLLSWMDNNAAVIVAPGFGGKPPEVLFVFEINDQKAVDGKLAKIRMKDYSESIGNRQGQARNSARKSDVGQLATALQAFFTTPGQGFYPRTLDDLVTSGDLRILPKDPSGESYGYLRCANGAEATVFIKLESGQYWAWSSYSGKAGYIENTPADCNFSPSSEEKSIAETLPTIEPQIENYNSATIYSNLIYDYKGEQWALRYAAGDELAIFTVSTSSQSIHEILDFKKSSKNTLAKEADWQEQFARASKNIGGIVYIVPENVMGFVDYFTSKEESYRQYAQSDWVVILRGYLKSLKSIGTTTTQEGKTLIANTFVNIEKLPDEESRKIEEAIDRVFKEQENAVLKSRDAVRKSDVGQLSRALELYRMDYSSYPATLNELQTGKYISSLPTDPESNSSYGYITCTNNTQAAVFAKLEETRTYWVWSSVSRKESDAGVGTAPTTCNVLGQKSGFNFWGIFKGN